MAVKKISEEIYRNEMDRMRLLPKYPELPINQQDMIRALRRITETDQKFLHDLISGFVDTAKICPRPSDLYERASAMRADSANKPLGNPNCPACGGTGWLHASKTVKVSGMAPYEADCSERCSCAPVAPKVA